MHMNMLYSFNRRPHRRRVPPCQINQFITKNVERNDSRPSCTNVGSHTKWRVTQSVQMLLPNHRITRQFDKLANVKTRIRRQVSVTAHRRWWPSFSVYQMLVWGCSISFRPSTIARFKYLFAGQFACRPDRTRLFLRSWQCDLMTHTVTRRDTLW